LRSKKVFCEKEKVLPKGKMNKEEAKQKVEELCERFRYNFDVYKKSTYNEAQVRREFIDPFFEALGWDVSNKQGYAEQYKEVIHEDTIKVGRSTRAPDYSFRIGGQRKFFVEAKKPAVNIKEDVSPSYQLRRYAWSAKLPLSVVTDFEEFSVFDCQIKPNPNDKPGMGRITYYTFEEYLDKFDEIYDVFSNEAILKGSFDRYAQSTKGKKGTAEVDTEFLKEIESWRELLAKNIALRNPEVSIYELNYAVQKLVDRIIFLRICEDRGIEPYGQLQTKAESGEVYKHLVNHFKLAESKYNSGIFDFEADKITSTLRIDDRVLKAIIQSLYYPKSPYEFSVLGVEILGNVYEQFLGKVIRLTAGHQAKVETKPEVKKAGGVYYTPQYIVDYIVKNTVGNLIAGKTPDEIAELKILDPACGSGSFLIGAYTYLLRYHLDWYAENKPKKHKEAVFQVRENEWYLTTGEKKRILLNNIFGVDIDPQAVEVTKLSLLLKVLEHESRESIDQQVKLGLEGVLPNLVDNIKCGNSLIGPDFYDTQQQETLFDEMEMRRINVFDWNDDVKGFGEIMKRGGFDCVIGNPPYVNAKNLVYLFKDEREYLNGSKKYETLYQKWDIYIPFIEKSLKLLNKNGLTSMIIPYPFVNQMYAKVLRRFILEKYNLVSITDLSSKKIFKDASVVNCIYVISNSKGVNKVDIRTINNSYKINKSTTKTYNELIQNKNTFVWNIKKEVKINFDIASNKLGDICFISKGLVLNADEKKAKGEFKKKDLISDSQTEINNKRYIEAKDIDRYIINRIRWLEWNTKRVPKLISRPTFPQLYETDKILINKIGNIKAALDNENIYCDQTIRIAVLWKNIKGIENRSINNSVKKFSKLSRNELEKISENFFEKYLLAILNSKVSNYILNQIRGTGNIDINPEYLKNIPIPKLDFSNPEEVAKHDKLVALVENMLELQKKYRDARMERDKEIYERQIKIVDVQIDRLVYELYGLTEEEMKVVEER